MEVNEFVKTTLLQIAEGVAAAKKEAEQHGALVNPISTHAYYSNPEKVNFDIAVTVQDENSKTAGGKLAIAIAKAEAGGSTSTTNTSVSRISFTVPISLAATPAKQYQ